MATIIAECNVGPKATAEATPVWEPVETMGVAGAGGPGDPFQAPPSDVDDKFADNDTAPNDGTIWNKTSGGNNQIEIAGRNANRNVLRWRETGGQSGTALPPELTAYDNQTAAGDKDIPLAVMLTGTTGTNGVSLLRYVETTTAAPGAGWIGQLHDAAPAEGAAVAGDQIGKKVVCATALGPSESKTFNMAVCHAHDLPAATHSVYPVLQYAVA